jgi:hypothetical protein
MAKFFPKKCQKCDKLAFNLIEGACLRCARLRLVNEVQVAKEEIVRLVKERNEAQYRAENSETYISRIPIVLRRRSKSYWDQANDLEKKLGKYSTECQHTIGKAKECDSLVNDLVDLIQQNV